ncbi:TatD family hydrolase [Pseudoalteromonas sp.]|uniref:TatD family hydrolase n=1 Tax=Pseudoalteromonas sp. TaxID=53249 RepID=UPI0035698796
MTFFDTHCHIDFAEFENDRDQVLADAAQYNVSCILVPGVSLALSDKVLALENTFDITFYKALGLHPYFLNEHQEGDFERLATLARNNREVLAAIGECGIDRSIDNLELQQQLFSQHIELANELSLPMVVHHRKSHDLIAEAFKTLKPQCGGIIHAFSGSAQVANYYIELGFKLGVGGTITYLRAHKTRDVIANMPIEHLVLETDAPSMPLYGFQGRRNVPSQIIRVFDVLCELKGVETQSARKILAEQLYASSCSVFRI